MNQNSLPSGRLSITRSESPDTVWLELYGELDLETTMMLDQQLAEIEAGGSSQLVIDLAGLEFMDSSGLHSIIQAQGSAAANGHSLALCRGPGQVQRLFELTQTADRLEFID